MSTLNLSDQKPNPHQAVADEYALEQRLRSGANWFFWIAALSLVNSAVFLFGGSWSFFAGLAVTQVVDGLVVAISGANEFSLARVITLGIDVFIAALFAACGVFAGRRQNWAFVAGMILYALDGVLALLFGAFLSAGFHVFALVMIFKGFSAARELNAAETAAQTAQS